MSFITQNLEFFLFICFLTLFLIFKRKKVEIQGSFPLLYMLLYKTTWGLNKMESWSKNFPRVFLYLAYYAFFIGVVGMVAMLFLMIWQLGFILENNISSGGGLVLPVKTQSGLEGAVPVFYVPFWYWIIALAILAIVHEFAHGVIAQRFKVKIKSSGFAFLGILAPILPAAFVEPDQKEMSKKPKWQQISILGAGSASNFLFGFFFLLLWVFLALPLVENTQQISQINFNSVMNQSQLNNYNISSGSIISFNNLNNPEEILSEFSNVSSNSSYQISIQSADQIKTFQVQPFFDETINRSLIGITNLELEFTPKKNFSWLGSIPLKVERLLFWLWVLNIGIGFMNLLPLWITDGGQIIRLLFRYKLNEKNSLILTNLFSLLSLVLIIFTINPNLLIKFLGLF